MQESHRLRLIPASALLFLTACASPPPRPQTFTYDDTYWMSVSCKDAAAPVRANCEAAHARKGIAPEQTREKRMPTPEEAGDAIDSMLASSLKDPTSAMQYHVSGARSCIGLIDSNAVTGEVRGCACYSVNSKNSYGAYAGQSLAIAELVLTNEDGPFLALNVPAVLYAGNALTGCPAMRERDSDLIRSKVH